MDEIIKSYLKLCVDYDNSPSNTKYCVQSILQDQQETPRGRKFLICQTLQQICELWDLGDYCYKQQLKYQELGMQGRRDVVPGNVAPEASDDEPKPKKCKLSEDTFQSNIAFFRTNYQDTTLPKSILHSYALKAGKDYPTYETQQEDKLFRTICTFDGKTYASTYWEKNKKFAEQGSALVCLLGLKMVQ
uniref:DRBM domain-containing protein n=1 Tax=Megaselia scalaris TaxID=36166 RepID=T1GG60_MEGSC